MAATCIVNLLPILLAIFPPGISHNIIPRPLNPITAAAAEGEPPISIIHNGKSRKAACPGIPKKREGTYREKTARLCESRIDAPEAANLPPM